MANSTDKPQNQNRIDPKVVAALVNRFVADSLEFLQNFARQAESRLSTLGQRVQRLERLVQLLERKLQSLPTDVGSRPAIQASRPAAVAVATQEQATSGGSQVAGAVAQPSAVEAAEEVQESAGPDPLYEPYRKMQRMGIPLLAIRQKLLLDAIDDPSLDVSVLDSFDGASGTGVGAKVMAPVAKPAPKPKPVAAPPPEEDTLSPKQAPEDSPEPAAPTPAAAPSPMAGMTMAEQAAVMAQKRRERAAAAAAAAENGAPPPAPTPAPKPKAKAADAPSLFRKRDSDVEAATSTSTPAEVGTTQVVTQTPGEGSEFPKTGDRVTMHYTGTLESGKEFDSSRDGDPFEFTIGAGTVIKGWEAGIPQILLGGKAKLTVPGHEGYGAQGSPSNGIPPDATLIFNVELLSINGRNAGAGAAAASSPPVVQAPPPVPKVQAPPPAPKPKGAPPPPGNVLSVEQRMAARRAAVEDSDQSDVSDF